MKSYFLLLGVESKNKTKKPRQMIPENSRDCKSNVLIGRSKYKIVLKCNHFNLFFFFLSKNRGMLS